MTSLRKSFARLVGCAVVIVVGMSVAILSHAFSPGFSSTLTSGVAMARPTPSPEPTRASTERFDDLVRDDFFAGMMGDTARLDRGMKFCEELLEKNPKHADALVWHGGGLLARSARAYAKGDSVVGERLWKQGLDEMNKAAELEPDNMRVKIGRSATLIGLAQSGWDSSDNEGRVLLLSALHDYEKVYEWQKPFFSKIGIHSRGELLFGLASGWSILGDQTKARFYLNLIVEHCNNSRYETEARRWLGFASLPTVQHECSGCHVKSSR